MTSTVTVFETTARRTVIKVNPAKYLHEVRAEACAKFNLSADKYGLKHNNKLLDLSTPFRQTGLAAGAKLELTLLSRSPGVVNVALQLPEKEAAETPNGRLVDKFPSTTTLWQILRKFEDGVAGSSKKRNLTARGLPLISKEGHGAGRLYYEQPVLLVMHKEMSSFVDLQKTLLTLGLNSGNVLIKLEFRPTEQPFEEAQEQIERYFQEQEGGEREFLQRKTEKSRVQVSAEEKLSTLTGPVVEVPESSHMDAGEENDQATDIAGSTVSNAQDEGSVTGLMDRPTAVFSAPSDSQPQAARIPHNEADYDYTVEHAQLQNAQYKSAGRNRTLPSDAQIEAKKRDAAERLASVQSVKIRSRFPDNTQAVAEFNRQDTSHGLYEHIRKLLRHENAPFTLRYRGSKGMFDIPDDGTKLIRDVGMLGNATVFLTWKEDASADIRKDPTLKAQVAAIAKEVEVPLLTDQSNHSNERESNVPPTTEKAGKKPGGMPAWLKRTLPGAKKY